MSSENEIVRELIIRPFVANDQPAARSLVLAGLEEHFGFIDETLNPDLDDISGRFLGCGHEFFVVESSGMLVGTGALLREAPGVARLARITVRAAFRRRGIARVMVKHLIHRARQHGCHRILVETNHDWSGAVNLYIGLGFREYDRDEESVHLEHCPL